MRGSTRPFQLACGVGFGVGEEGLGLSRLVAMRRWTGMRGEVGSIQSAGVVPCSKSALEGLRRRRGPPAWTMEDQEASISISGRSRDQGGAAGGVGQERGRMASPWM